MIDKIEADLKAALLARDQLKTNVLKGIKNSIKNESIAKRKELTEDEITAVIKREAKQRDEAAAAYNQGGATERAEQELAERIIIDEYLPRQMDEAQVLELVKRVASEFDNDPLKTGQIIGKVLAETKGQSDGQTVARLVKQHLP